MPIIDEDLDIGLNKDKHVEGIVSMFDKRERKGN